jgi:hypothetical protein
MVPVLLLSGAESYPFLRPISEELARLLSNREAIVLPNAGHQMWYQAKCFESLNAGKSYPEQIKPFNFLQTCQLSPFGHPDGVDPEKCHLISPYDPDPRKWFEKEWVDQYTGKRFRITTRGYYGSRNIARVAQYNVP